MVENVALQVAEVWCWGPVTLCIFSETCLAMLLGTKKQEVCACALVKIAVKLRDKLLEGWYTVQWCCQFLLSVAKSRAEFYFVQRFAQQKHCETTHVTLCNSPATCLATALRDKLLRKLHNVTGPSITFYTKLVVDLHFYCTKNLYTSIDKVKESLISLLTGIGATITFKEKVVQNIFLTKKGGSTTSFCVKLESIWNVRM